MINCLLFYTISAVFQLYHDGDMIYSMRRRNPKPTLLPTQRIFKLPHHVGMVWAELAFDDVVKLYTVEMDCNTAKCYGSDRNQYPCHQGHQLSALTNWAITPPPDSTMEWKWGQPRSCWWGLIVRLSTPTHKINIGYMGHTMVTDMWIKITFKTGEIEHRNVCQKNIQLF